MPAIISVAAMWPMTARDGVAGFRALVPGMGGGFDGGFGVVLDGGRLGMRM
jgi:hypothetical protein